MQRKKAKGRKINNSAEKKLDFHFLKNYQLLLLFNCIQNLAVVTAKAQAVELLTGDLCSNLNGINYPENLTVVLIRQRCRLELPRFSPGIFNS